MPPVGCGTRDRLRAVSNPELAILFFLQFAA